jgi:hypothetical protein
MIIEAVHRLVVPIRQTGMAMRILLVHRIPARLTLFFVG